MLESGGGFSAEPIKTTPGQGFSGDPRDKDPGPGEIERWIRGWESLRYRAQQLALELPDTYLTVQLPSVDRNGNRSPLLNLHQSVSVFDGDEKKCYSLADMIGSFAVRFQPVRVGKEDYVAFTHVLCHAQLARACQAKAEVALIQRARLDAERAEDFLLALAQGCANHMFQFPLGDFRPNPTFVENEPLIWMQMLREAGMPPSLYGGAKGPRLVHGFPREIVPSGFSCEGVLVDSVEPGIAGASVMLIDGIVAAATALVAELHSVEGQIDVVRSDTNLPC